MTVVKKLSIAEYLYLSDLVYQQRIYLLFFLCFSCVSLIISMAASLSFRLFFSIHNFTVTIDTACNIRYKIVINKMKKIIHRDPLYVFILYTLWQEVQYWQLSHWICIVVYAQSNCVAVTPYVHTLFSTVINNYAY